MKIYYFDQSNTGMGHIPASTLAVDYSYNVTLSGDLLSLDSIQTPHLEFTLGQKYLFTQNDSTNAGYKLTFPYYDFSSQIWTDSTLGITPHGVPGRNDAYVLFTGDISANLRKYCLVNSAGNRVTPLDTPQITVTDISFGGSSTKALSGLPFTVTFDNNFTSTSIYQIKNDSNTVISSGTIDYGTGVNVEITIDSVNPSGTYFIGWEYGTDVSFEVEQLQSYKFTVQTNIFNDPVYAVYNTTDDVYYNQSELLFTASNVYLIDVSDPSNDDYVLSFGTTADVYDATIESSYVARTGAPGTNGAIVLLDLTNYSGDALVYFEQDVSGMGYLPYEVVGSITVSETDVQDGNIDVSVVGEQSVITFKAPTTRENATYSHTITLPNNVDFSYVAVGAGGSGGRTGSSESYNSGGGHGGFVIEGSYSLTPGVYSVNIPGYSEGFYSGSDVGVTSIGYAGLACELKNDSGTTLIYSQGGNGSYSKADTSTYAVNYNSIFSFDGITYDRSGNNEGRGGHRTTAQNGNDGKTITSIPGISSIVLGGGGGRSEYQNNDDAGKGGNGGGGDGGHSGGRLVGAYGENHTGGGGGGGGKNKSVFYSRGGSGVMYMWGNFNVNVSAITYTVTYTVTVSNNVFNLDSSANPQINFTENTVYIFDQSDSSNTGEQIVFGYGVDNKINFFTSANGVTVVGTPGQPGAYTLFEVPSGLTGTVYYYSINTGSMGNS